MVTFNIIFLAAAMFITCIYSYFFLETLNKYFIGFIFIDICTCIIGRLISCLIFNKYYLLFFICAFIAMILLAVICIAIKSIAWNTRVIYEEEEKLRQEAIKNNPYYQEANQEINGIINGKPKIDLEK